jgi:hypothetical protein
MDWIRMAFLLGRPAIIRLPCGGDAPGGEGDQAECRERTRARFGDRGERAVARDLQCGSHTRCERFVGARGRRREAVRGVLGVAFEHHRAGDRRDHAVARRELRGLGSRGLVALAQQPAHFVSRPESRKKRARRRARGRHVGAGRRVRADADRGEGSEASR